MSTRGSRPHSKHTRRNVLYVHPMTDTIIQWTCTGHSVNFIEITLLVQQLNPIPFCLQETPPEDQLIKINCLLKIIPFTVRLEKMMSELLAPPPSLYTILLFTVLFLWIQIFRLWPFVFLSGKPLHCVLYIFLQTIT